MKLKCFEEISLCKIECKFKEIDNVKLPEGFMFL